MAAPKVKFGLIDEYISAFPEAVRAKLQTIRQIVRDEAPDAEEAIKYNMPMFVFHGNLVGFAAWKKHIGLYPVTAEMAAAFGELSGFRTSGKGTVQFPHNQPLPEPLIRKLVAFRVVEHRAKKAGGK